MLLKMFKSTPNKTILRIFTRCLFCVRAYFWLFKWEKKQSGYLKTIERAEILLKRNRSGEYNWKKGYD